MKVRYIEETAHELTKGKSYRVLREHVNRYVIKDNEGDEISALKHHFEIVETNNERNAGRKKVPNGVIIRTTVQKELVNEFKQLVKNWRGLQRIILSKHAQIS